MVDFAAMRANRGGNLDKLREQVNNMDKRESEGPDERFWKMTVDKAGNGSAVIRFLPAPGEETAPYVRYYQHGFQGPKGQYYIEKSLTTIGQPDPVSEINKKLWDTGTKENQDLVRKRKRNLNFVSNIYVVKDSSNSENEGKVFLYRYGKKIFDMLNECMNPSFEGEEAFDPFDLWDGANFNLRANMNGEGKMAFRSYDKSKFASRAPLLKDDAAIEVIWKSEYSLAELVAPEAFKSYDELKARLYKVLDQESSDEANTTQRTQPRRLEVDLDDDIPFKAGSKKTPASEEDDDESMKFFANLAKD